jgi:hypothetical protein
LAAELTLERAAKGLLIPQDATEAVEIVDIKALSLKFPQREQRI